jgi:hypothetical protein
MVPSGGESDVKLGFSLGLLALVIKLTKLN